ncbi:MAG: hypothetical protein ACP6IS_04895 [Candidatus Asgardarchaeia archaeon]
MNEKSAHMEETKELIDVNKFVEKLLISAEKQILEKKLSDIRKQANELELKWKLGDISSSKVKEEARKLLEEKEEIISRLDELANKDENTEVTLFLNNVLSLARKVDKLEKLSWKVGISKSFIESLRKSLKQQVKENQELIKAFKSNYKKIKKSLEKSLKALQVEKDSLKVSKILGEISDKEFSDKMNNIEQKIFIYNKALEELKIIKKQISQVEKFRWLL